VPFFSLVLRARARVRVRVRVKIRVSVSPDTFIISKDYNIEYRLDYR
jgi:hypothetical protein